MPKKHNRGKLHQEFKRRWVEALRSGQYKQGRRMLYNRETESYCCLGVGCLINGDQIYGGLGSLGLPRVHEAEAWWDVLPSSGDPSLPVVKHRGKWYTLTQLNDDLALPFAKIADLIEEQL